MKEHVVAIACVGVTGLLLIQFTKANDKTNPMSKRPDITIDHIVYAVPDLKAAMNDFFLRSGVQPKYGGKHTSLGTHNALISLGEGTYFEMLAPDPEQNNPEGLKQLGISEIKKPFLSNWAIGVRDLKQLRNFLKDNSFDLTELIKGHRKTADGSEVNYTAADVVTASDKASLHLPFAIDWGTTPHPSIRLPVGCSLKYFEIRTPNSDQFKHFNQALNLPVAVIQATSYSMRIKIKTPRGLLTFK